MTPRYSIRSMRADTAGGERKTAAAIFLRGVRASLSKISKICLSMVSTGRASPTRPLPAAAEEGLFLSYYTGLPRPLASEKNSG